MTPISARVPSALLLRDFLGWADFGKFVRRDFRATVFRTIGSPGVGHGIGNEEPGHHLVTGL
jgi:hypothetical protein